MLKYTARYTEAGLCWRPYSRGLGSPSMRETHYQDLRRHGRQYRPEALLVVGGKPGRAGGPRLKYTARYREAGLCRKPCSRGLGSPSTREAH